MAQLLEGKPLAERALASIKREIGELKLRKINPALAVVLVGNDPASVAYVNGKDRKAKEVGIDSRKIELPKSATEGELLELIRKLNVDKGVHAILVQFPLPSHISERKIRDSILPEKDVDGLNSLNAGKLLSGDETLAPCTPKGIIGMLESHGIRIAGRRAVVVGRSLLVGKPIANMLLNRDATVTVCHSKTANLPEITREADILVVAVGKPGLIGAEMVKKGAVVLDVGINRVGGATVKEDMGNLEIGRGAKNAHPDPKGNKPKLVGDVDFDSVEKKASAITPVPGGIGPMTIAMLMKNTLICAKLQNGLL
ncbi:MAG: tetrahydrofolate dehydrogenase/cyclohydrolase catalytic domain-containing protein [Candidatus Micrarchaeota archaeon]